MSNLLDRFLAAQTAQDHADMQHQVSHGQDKSIAQMHTEAWNNMVNAPGRLAQGVFTGIAGAPVEVANMALKPLGLGSDNPVGGMNSLARLVGADTNSLPYQAGTMLPIDPGSILGAAHGIPAMVGMFAGAGAKTADIGKLVDAEKIRASIAADYLDKTALYQKTHPDSLALKIADEHSAPITETTVSRRAHERQDAGIHPEDHKDFYLRNGLRNLNGVDVAEAYGTHSLPAGEVDASMIPSSGAAQHETTQQYADRVIQRQKAQSVAQDSPTYANDMEAQIHMLAAKAQQHGYTSIDDFAAKNPEAFGSAAADWRGGHSMDAQP